MILFSLVRATVFIQIDAHECPNRHSLPPSSSSSQTNMGEIDDFWITMHRSMMNCPYIYNYSVLWSLIWGQIFNQYHYCRVPHKHSCLNKCTTSLSPQHFVMENFTKNQQKLAKLAETPPSQCSPGAPRSTRVFVNMQGAFIWHYTVRVMSCFFNRHGFLL